MCTSRINDSYGSRTAFGFAHDLKLKSVERMEWIKNADFRTYGLLDAGASIRTCIFWPPTAAFAGMAPLRFAPPQKPVTWGFVAAPESYHDEINEIFDDLRRG